MSTYQPRHGSLLDVALDDLGPDIPIVREPQLALTAPRWYADVITLRRLGAFRWRAVRWMDGTAIRVSGAAITPYAALRRIGAYGRPWWLP